jgi:Zn-dependent peptidase ImmA (M78 family)
MAVGEETRPGHRFIIEKGTPSAPSGLDSYIGQYVGFLRGEATVNGEIPVPIAEILGHFDVEYQTGEIEGDRQGFKFSGDRLPYQVVFIEEGDKQTRRRFSLSHELIELLFEALNDGKLSPQMREACSGPRKERLCDQGAADLLMPEDRYQDEVHNRPVSFGAASKLASMFKVSFLAALLQMVEVTSRPFLLIAWRRKLKPTQQGQRSSRQLSLPEMGQGGPAKRLRVEWRRWTEEPSDQHVPTDISVPDRSMIRQAFEEGKRISGTERLKLGDALSGTFDMEAMPVRLGEDQYVLSLLDVSTLTNAGG